MTASERPQIRDAERSEPHGTAATATDTESAVAVDGVRKRFGSGPGSETGYVFTPGTDDVTVVDLAAGSVRERLGLGGSAFVGS